MERTLLGTVSSLFIIFLLGLELGLPMVKSSPTTIYVDGNNSAGSWDGSPQHPYQNISSALTHVSTGDTVFVRNGLYREHLTISVAVSLQGESTNSTTIDGSGASDVVAITADSVNITDFTIQNSGSNIGDCGIQISSTHNNISHNVIKKSYNGILLYSSNYNAILDNRISNNTYGIQVYYSQNDTISRNEISNNDFGTYCVGLTESVLKANLFLDNSLGSALIFNSNNNTLFHNNFINNTQQLRMNDTKNRLDNGIEGNYWSDYNGTDEDQNGIWDSPYVIDTDNQDNYPLMAPCTEFTITHGIKTFITSIISNSTISAPQFDSTMRMLTFNASGTNNTSGFCRITIPEQLIPKPYIVLVNNEQVNATSLPASNATHNFLIFSYNHTMPLEVRILSEPFIEIWTIYSNLLEKYTNLNSTYYQLLANYNSLNQTYQQTLANYTRLLNQYNTLNQTFEEALSNYTKLTAEHNLLNQTYQELIANYTKLQNDYNSTQTDYSVLLEQYNSLNSTHALLLSISGAAAAIMIVTSSLAIIYNRRSKRQEKLVEKYKDELERISLLDIARTLFQEDVQRRHAKIEKFGQKYGISVKPRGTLEDVIANLELKKKKEESK